jgi:hypothetical protein
MAAINSLLLQGQIVWCESKHDAVHENNGLIPIQARGKLKIERVIRDWRRKLRKNGKLKIARGWRRKKKSYYSFKFQQSERAITI